MPGTCDPDAGPFVMGDYDRPRRLRDEIAEALRSNLDRGYLESEERFRQIVEGLDDVVSLTDRSGTQLFFINAAYERVWGRPRADLYPDPLACVEGVHPDDRARVRELLVRHPPVAVDIEFRVIRPDGDQRWVWCRGFPVRNAAGEIYRIARIMEDITERKAIAESHQRLLRGFTHDVKNPLGAADGYLSLLETGVFGEISSVQRENVARARRSIRTALNLVAHLLEIERAEAGELDVERTLVDLAALTHDCVEDFRAAAYEKRQTVTLLLPQDKDALVIESDRARVRQILANLVSNAVKYTQADGRITVSARLADTGDDAAPWRGHWVVLSVADTGPGIPAEKHHLLFREFARFNPGAADGSGIGLAISQHLARALGASITFTSATGVGTTFNLWLPRNPADALPLTSA